MVCIVSVHSMDIITGKKEINGKGSFKFLNFLVLVRAGDGVLCYDFLIIDLDNGKCVRLS